MISGIDIDAHPWRQTAPALRAMLEKGDVLLVAGKGHETGQTVGTTVIPFSDHEAVSAALNDEAKLG